LADKALYWHFLYIIVPNIILQATNLALSIFPDHFVRNINYNIIQLIIFWFNTLTSFNYLQFTRTLYLKQCQFSQTERLTLNAKYTTSGFLLLPMVIRTLSLYTLSHKACCPSVYVTLFMFIGVFLWPDIACS
jgi:hypothetical protein